MLTEQLIDETERPVLPPQLHRLAVDTVEKLAQPLFRPYEVWVRQGGGGNRFGDPGCPLGRWAHKEFPGVSRWFDEADYIWTYEALVAKATRWLQSHNHSSELPARGQRDPSQEFWDAVDKAAEAQARVWAILLDAKLDRELRQQAEADKRRSERDRLREQHRVPKKVMERELKLIDKMSEAEARIAQFARDLDAHRSAQAARHRLEEMFSNSRNAALRLRNEFGERADDPQLPDVPQAPQEVVEFVKQHDWLPASPKGDALLARR